MTSLLLLHGLTFDHHQWDPVRRHLDPSVPVVAPDLPGHGATPAWPSYDTSALVDWLHTQAGPTPPVVVGHSLGGVLATIYAARYPVEAVLNVDQVLLPGPFGDLVREAVPVLRGPSWRTVWDGLVAGMHVDRLPPDMQQLVLTGSRPTADLLLGYWSDLITYTNDEIAAQRSAELAAIAARAIPYRFVTSAEPPRPYLDWMVSLLPHLERHTIPGGSHFPHLADPAAVARLILDGDAAPKAQAAG
jgi:pimeloyl-ACP methyl ester carboxylesterase